MQRLAKVVLVNSYGPTELHGIQLANNRMQLTWLLGAPSQPVSVHWLAVGRRGLGSPATQLMRAVSRYGPFGGRFSACLAPRVALY